MSEKLAGLLKRLARVETALAEAAERERLAACICKVAGKCPPTSVFASDAERFEAEMNQTCPVHGFRDLGLVRYIQFIEPGVEYKRCRIDELLDEYHARKSQHSRPIENASQEA